MKIALAQINPIVGDLEHNFKLMLKHIEDAKQAGVELIIFPELSLLGYPPKDLILKHGLIEAQDYYINELALYSDSDFAIVVGGVTENKGFGNKFFNSLICLVDGEIDFVAHKTLLPSYDVFDENRYFEPCPKVMPWSFKGIKFGLSICEDIWLEAYPHLYNRNPISELVAAGAEILVNAAASPYTFTKSKTRVALMQNLVKLYKLPLLYINQVGANDQLIFDGASLALKANADIEASANAFVEESIYIDSDDLLIDVEGSAVYDFSRADLSLSEPKDSLRGISGTSLDVLDKLDTANLDELESALVLGLKDYVHKCGFLKVVIGLSGGVDSALVAYLASKALGAENVYAYMLPSKFTSDESFKDAEELANNLGVNYKSISIADLHSAMQELIPSLSDLADENLQPRLRANMLMAIANSIGAILLATSNKSEIAVGYSTLYGDTCGALAVIGDLLKTVVYSLVKNINTRDKVIPQNIIDKAPSAELRPDQRDTDSLPDYEILDQIILLYVEELKSLQQIIDLGLDEELVKKVLNMIDRAEYKRQQAPPILKVASKAFGIGRRMPIAQGFKHS